jgi:hypothetical protein
VNIAFFLNGRRIGDGEVAVGHYFHNINRRRVNTFSLRALAMLTGRRIRVVRREIGDPATSPGFLPWAEARGIRYLVHRPPVSPWRVWHFRVPGLQERLSRQVPTGPTPYFVLYEIRNGALHPVSVPEVEDWPRRVPFPD